MNAARIAEKIRAHMEANAISQMELSRSTGISQSTISRALKAPVRLTKTHRQLCKFAGISLEGEPQDRRGREALVRAVLAVWDGTSEHADSIARLLNAGASLEAHATSRVFTRRKPHAARQ